MIIDEHLIKKMTELSKLEMKAEGWRKHGAAVAVVSGVIDVLRVERGVDAAPHVQRVLGFDDVLASVVQCAVAEQEAHAAQGQIFLVVA